MSYRDFSVFHSEIYGRNWKKEKKGEINKAKAVALAMDADNMPIEKISQYVIESVLSI